jgi:hypothetical protein
MTDPILFTVITCGLTIAVIAFTASGIFAILQWANIIKNKNYKGRK